MIIVQNLELEIIGTFTTLKGFLREYNNNGAKLSSYDYVRGKLFDAGLGEQIRYRRFYITKSLPLAGKKDMSNDGFRI